jgi:hypothetical protein
LRVMRARIVCKEATEGRNGRMQLRIGIIGGNRG